MNDPLNLTSVTLARAAAFRLGALDVKPPTREVIGANCRDVLEPRVMQVLVVLAQANGDVVTRDDLMTRCWDGRVVGDDALNRVIGKIRRLAARPDSGFTLETIRKVGYRLSAETTPSNGDHAAPTPAPEGTRTSKRRLIWPWLATGLVAIAFMAWVALAAALPPASGGDLLAEGADLPPAEVSTILAGRQGRSPGAVTDAILLSSEQDLAVAEGAVPKPLTGAAAPAGSELPVADSGASNRPMSLLPPA